MIHLVTGGVRAGKSRHALGLAPPGRIGFIATAEGFDDEMRTRIEHHRAERGDRFRTFEAPLRPDLALAAPMDGFVLDCLTVWVGNLLHHEAGEEPVEALLGALPLVSVPVIVVTNEVGLGIMPADPLSRRYLDLLGRVNQRVAALAARVTLLVSGVPVPVR